MPGARLGSGACREISEGLSFHQSEPGWGLSVDGGPGAGVFHGSHGRLKLAPSEWLRFLIIPDRRHIARAMAQGDESRIGGLKDGKPPDEAVPWLRVTFLAVCRGQRQLFL